MRNYNKSQTFNFIVRSFSLSKHTIIKPFTLTLLPAHTNINHLLVFVGICANFHSFFKSSSSPLHNQGYLLVNVLFSKKKKSQTKSKVKKISQNIRRAKKKKEPLTNGNHKKPLTKKCRTKSVKIIFFHNKV